MSSVLLPPPRFRTRPAHDAFFASAKTYRALIGGIGSGKTAALAIEAHMHALEYPGVRGMVTAPTYGMLKDTTIPAWEEWAPPGLDIQMHWGDLRATYPNGSIIYFRSTLRPNSLRGPNLGWAALDEAAYTLEESWQVIKGRVRDRRCGHIWLATTPKGKKHWIYREFVASPKRTHRWWRLRTAENAENLREGFIEELGYAGNFAAQELEGEFVSYEGLIYAYDAGTHGFDLLPNRQWARREAGVDWGFSHPAVILPGLWSGGVDDTAWVPEEFYATRRTIGHIVDAAKAIQKTYDISVFRCDPSEPSFIEEFRAAGLNAIPADNAILPGIGSVTSRLDRRPPGVRLHRSCVRTAAELDSYSWATAGNRDAPANGQADHAMDALRYLLHSTPRGGIATAEVGDRPRDTSNPFAARRAASAA